MALNKTLLGLLFVMVIATSYVSAVPSKTFCQIRWGKDDVKECKDCCAAAGFVGYAKLDGCKCEVRLNLDFTPADIKKIEENMMLPPLTIPEIASQEDERERPSDDKYQNLSDDE